MIVTEEEAKKKWCPLFAILMGLGGIAGVRDIKTLHTATFCNASDCMMWRWTEKPWERLEDWTCNHSALCKVELHKDDAYDLDECPECGADIVGNYKPVPGKGYCGLGGRP